MDENYEQGAMDFEPEGAPAVLADDEAAELRTDEQAGPESDDEEDSDAEVEPEGADMGDDE